jgi:hypothetical protein
VMTDSAVCGILGLLLHDPLATQTSQAGAEMWANPLSSACNEVRWSNSWSIALKDYPCSSTGKFIIVIVWKAQTHHDRDPILIRYTADMTVDKMQQVSSPVAPEVDSTKSKRMEWSRMFLMPKELQGWRVGWESGTVRWLFRMPIPAIVMLLSVVLSGSWRKAIRI